MAPDAAVDIGRHDLRLEQIDAEGRLVAQISLPFMRASPAETQQLALGEMIVQPGTSLWRIARNTYGRGVMFTVIYLANARPDRRPGFDLSRADFHSSNSPLRRHGSVSLGGYA